MRSGGGARGSVQEPGCPELGRDLLDGLLDVPGVTAPALRSSWAPRSDVATMFWTSISGSFLIGMPAASICFATMAIAVLTFSRLFAPVQTTFPLRKRRIAVFGSLMRAMG